ncbi:MAG TPA: class II aldolase/adducin family protein [Methanomicrobiales archaeon]|nr:class II aldolase/adducin family protein [Methanomicrobiales archaeon]
MSGSGSASGDLARIGRRAVAEGLATGNVGNASVRTREGFLVTRTGAYLDEPGPLVFVTLDGDVPAGASRESLIHRAVYLETRHLAILHTHPAHAVALSLSREKISPVDPEGMALCPAIPVVGGAPGSQRLADRVADALLQGKVAIARGHGTFAAGKDFEEAYLVTSAAEYACRILHLAGAHAVRPRKG